MADYVYSVAIQVNSFQNNMADKTVWRIKWGRINEYSLYVYVVKAHVIFMSRLHRERLDAFMKNVIQQGM